MTSLKSIHREIVRCEACPRLRKHCEAIALAKRRAYKDQEYWGKPLPGFGDPEAELILVGLAPAAHGGNRTGRVFTGDRSGDWLYRALYKAGFANQPQSTHVEDGLELKNAFITVIARCAPPDNKPLPEEIENCRAHLVAETSALMNAKVWLALGQIALNGIWPLLAPGQPRPKFNHGGKASLPDGKTIIMSYHPSQQNTFTGRLTEPMFDSVFQEARKVLRKT